MKNFTLLIVSLCISVGLFLFVHGQNNNVQRTVVMPVEVHNKPKDKFLIQENDIRQIQVTVQGPSYFVNEIISSVRPVKLTLPADVADFYSFSIRKEMLGFPAAVDVLNIEPKQIDVKIDRLVKKTVPVLVPRIGKVKSEHRVASLVIVPEVVEIVGAANEVDKLTYIHTTPLNMSGIVSDTNLRLSITDSLQHAQVVPNEVTVMVRIAPEQISRVFEGIDVSIHSKNKRYVNINPKKVWLKVTGPKNIVENMTEDDVTAFVKLGMNEKSTAKVRFSLPDGVTAMGWNPTYVDVLYDGSQALEANGEKK